MNRTMFVFMMAFMLAGASLFAQMKKAHGGHGKGGEAMKGDCWMMHEGGMMGTGMNVDVLKKQLKLTDEQAAKIKTLVAEHKKDMLAQKENLAPKEIKLKRLMLEDAVNLDEVQSLVMEIAKIKGEMHFAMIKNRVEINKVLTAEQREKLKGMHRMRGPMKKKMPMKKEKPPKKEEPAKTEEPAKE